MAAGAANNVGPLIASLLHGIVVRTGASAAAVRAAGDDGDRFAWPTAEAAQGRPSNGYPLAAGAALFLVGTERPPAPLDLELAGSCLSLVAENENLKREADRLACEVRATFEVTRELCRSQDLDRLLLLVADKSRELLGCELAGFALLDDLAETIVWKAMSGCVTDVYRRLIYRRDGGVAGRAIGSRAPVIVEDFLGDPSFDPAEFPISFAEGLRSVVGVPLEIAGIPRGCLMVGYRHVHHFTGEEIALLTSFAAQAAIAIETAQLYEQLRHEQARLESIVQSVNEGIILVDAERNVVYVNRRAEELFGVSREHCAHLHVDQFIEEVVTQLDDPARARLEFARIGGNLAGFPSFDIALAREPGRTVRVTLFAVHGEQKAELGRGYLCRDITVEKQVDAMKSEIISIVSHELRTPLASIRGYASALLDKGRRRDARLQLEYLRSIDEESTRLDDLVANLLDVSKLDAGVLEMDRRPFDMNSLVRSRVARWRESETQHRFLCETPPEEPMVELDHVRIEQVLDNLIANAIDSAPPATAIVVRVARSGPDVRVSVTDEGPGIPVEERERVFERFYRIAAGRARRQGSGLGLYICRGIIKAHGGHIWIESRLGAGATFFFSLPVHAQAQAPGDG